MVILLLLKAWPEPEMYTSFNVICPYIWIVFIPKTKLSWLGTNDAADIPWAGGRADNVEKS